MNRTPLSILHRIRQSLSWYGHEYVFYEDYLNEFNEPTGHKIERQRIIGIYHSSERSFIELLNAEGSSVKGKTNKGILCSPERATIEQGYKVCIDGVEYKITSYEPIIYCDVVIAREISLEEIIQGSNDV